MDTSIPANCRVSLIHLETVELDTSTYGWIKLNSRKTQGLEELSHTSNFYEVYEKQIQIFPLASTYTLHLNDEFLKL